MSYAKQFIPHLSKYVAHTNLLAYAQLLLFVFLLYRFLVRSLTSTWYRAMSAECDVVIADQFMEELTRLCFALGLLLTFSGLYAYIGNPNSSDTWSLMLALGSSAVGYSAWTICALGSAVDVAIGTVDGDLPGADLPDVVDDEIGNDVLNSSDRDAPPRHVVDEVRRRSRRPVVEHPPIVSQETEMANRSSERDELNFDEGRKTDESKTHVHIGSSSRHLGGVVHHSDSTTEGLGGLAGYQRSSDSEANSANASADADLDKERWDDGVLAADYT